MKRLARLIRLVEAEQKVVRNGGSSEALCKIQDRLLQHLSRTGKTAPYELFMIPIHEVKKCSALTSVQ
jgi:hypothetical protein